jgi:3-oxoacyl-[acyl-carrier protein] reductase
MSDKLSNKVALVTGGSRGIGAAIAQRLAAEGATVAITYASSPDKANAVVESIVAGGGQAIAIQADSANAAAVRSAVDETVRTFGRIDVLVNNAGIAGFSTFEDQKIEEFDRMVDVNVKAVFVAAQAASRHMGEGGRIVNIGSVVGERVGLSGISVYSMTKAAVAGLTRGLARDLGPRGITVNTVQPGPIDTDMNPADGDLAKSVMSMIPVGHYGHANDIASLVAYLAGPDTGFLTGASLNVDGGLAA